MKVLNAALILAVSIVLSNAAAAQTKAAGKPKFDAKLAKRLGADQYGMKSYVLVLLRTGPNDANVTGSERDDLFKGHLANIRRLAAEGKLAVAGPFGKNDKSLRGLFILNAATIEEARKIVVSDPAIKAGIFITELIPWYGTAALLETSGIHQRIAKEDP